MFQQLLCISNLLPLAVLRPIQPVLYSPPHSYKGQTLCTSIPFRSVPFRSNYYPSVKAKPATTQFSSQKNFEPAATAALAKSYAQLPLNQVIELKNITGIATNIGLFSQKATYERVTVEKKIMQEPKESSYEAIVIKLYPSKNDLSPAFSYRLLAYDLKGNPDDYAFVHDAKGDIETHDRFSGGYFSFKSNPILKTILEQAKLI